MSKDVYLQPYDYSLSVMHDFERRKPYKAYAQNGLHMSLTPRFQLGEATEEEVIEAIKEAGEEIGAFEIKTGGEALYGSRSDRLVTEVEDSDGSVRELHKLLLQKLGELGVRFAHLRYCKENFKPHITHQPDKTIPEVPYTCDSLTVVKKFGSATMRTQVVVATIPLEPDIPMPLQTASNRKQ